MTGKVTPGSGNRGHRGPTEAPTERRSEGADLLRWFEKRLGPLYGSVRLAGSGATAREIGEAAGYRHKGAEAVGKDRLRLALPLLADLYAERRDQDRGDGGVHAESRLAA